MKKIFLLAITLLCAAVLTACGAQNADYPRVPHTECTEFTDWEVNFEPTCTEVGQKYRFCLECGTKIELLGENEMICPSCGKNTFVQEKCEHCGAGLMVYCENKRCGALQFFQNTKCTACGKKIKAKIGGR